MTALLWIFSNDYIKLEVHACNCQIKLKMKANKGNIELLDNSRVVFHH